MSRHTAFIALGSNLGDRVSHLHAALRLMGNASTSRAMAKHKWDGTERSGDDMTVLATSHLYSTPPMYYTQQPSFLNAVCKVSTQLDPLTLLRRLQSIESAVGRTKSFQNGPRVVDLDILLYDNQIISHKKDNEHLEIPHPRMHSRGFTLLPLCDIAADLEHPAMKRPMASLLQSLSANDLEDIKRVWPLTRSEGSSEDHAVPISELSDSINRPLIAGVLNMTPDSFSDGGQYLDVETAFKQAAKMVFDGADMVDIGGESTRPGATIISADDELNRVIPIIRLIRERQLRCLISIDTRSSAVAAAAIDAGADIVNDVSGGKHDPNMLDVVAERSVPIILMHMRGTPQTMASPANSTYKNVVEEVATELQEICEAADRAGIPRWRQIIDPGIGFAKGIEENRALMTGKAIQRMKQLLGGRPMMVGMSRKRFLQTILQDSLSPYSRDQPAEISMIDRDWATAGICCGLATAGVEILRVHDVRGVKAAMSSYLNIYGDPMGSD